MVHLYYEALSLVVRILSYFESGLCTGAAVLTAKHQKGLHSQNRVLLQLYYIWGGEIHGNTYPWHTQSKDQWGLMWNQWIDEQLAFEESLESH